VTAEAARDIVAGFGIRSYLMGLDAVAEMIADEQAAAIRT
jgi:3-dehydroquinate dehydratase